MRLDEARQGDKARWQCDEDSNLINKLVLEIFTYQLFYFRFGFNSPKSVF